MKLYYSPGSCGLAPQIILREVGQHFELVKVDFKTKQTTEGDYLQVSPKGMVPALRLDDDEIVTEGAVILQWIADKHPESKLIPPTGFKERYTVLEWLNYIATDLHKGMAVMFSTFIDKDSKIRFAEGNLGPRFEYINEHLADRNYILGANFSVADAYLYNILTWPTRVGIDISGYSSIQAFMSRMEQRSAVRASLEAERLSI